MQKIKKILNILIVFFAVIGLATTVFIAFDYAQARSAKRGVSVGTFPHIFRPNIEVNRGQHGGDFLAI
jgi:hypothetical protein